MRLLPLLGLLWLTACGDPSHISRSDFPTMAGDVLCERIRECARGEFERDYFGMGDCVRHWERGMRELDRTFHNLGCSYDEEGAARAWRNVQNMSCEHFYQGRFTEEYDKVWDC